MPRSHFIATLASFCIFLSASSRVHSQCEIGWSNPVQLEYPDGGIPRTEFDEDGDGPNPPLTIFSGWIGSAGGIPVSQMTAWNGTYWQSFPGATVPTATVYTMLAVDEDVAGPERPVLWAGGNFTSIDGIAAGKVARFDHGEWHGIAGGVPAFPFDSIRQLIDWDMDGDGPLAPVIYARTDAGMVARLMGDAWESVGNSGTSEFAATEIIIADLDGGGPEQPTLVRAGRLLGQSTTGEVQKWTGTQWDRFGGVFNRRPVSAVKFDPDQGGPLASELYVSGNFTSIGALPIRGIARWRDNEWQPLEIQLGNSSSFYVDLAVGDDDGHGPRPDSLFASGTFYLPGSTSAENQNWARWDGRHWEGLGINFPIAYSMGWGQMNVHGQRIFQWIAYGGGMSFIRDFSGWRRIAPSSVALVEQLDALDLDGPGPLGKSIVMAGTGLEVICDGVANGAASWNGRAWTPLTNAELPGSIDDIGLFDFDAAGQAPPQLIAAGRFNFGGSYYGVATIQNGTWMPLLNTRLVSSGERASRMTIYDSDGDGPAEPMLLLGGNFLSVNNNPNLRYLVRWTPTGCVPVSPALNQAVTDMVVQDDDGTGSLPPALYVAGPMSVGSMAVNGIARWDGVNWRPLVDAMTGEILTPNPVKSMCSLQEEPGRYTLCVGGNFSTAQGFWRAARWKNSHWLPMGTTLPNSVVRMVGHTEINGGNVNNIAYCLASSASSEPLHPKNIYQWDGLDWQRLTDLTYGSNGPLIGDMVSIDIDGDGPVLPQLCIYGGFELILPVSAGYLPAANIAFWGPRQPFFFATPWNRSIAAGDRLSLKVATGGPEPMTFAWTRDGVTLADGGTVSGATTRELVINPVAFGDSGQYECIATNACGSIPSGSTLVRVCAALATGDLNADGHIDGLDISPFVAMWTSPPSPQSDCAVDLTHNGVRDPDDIAWFIGRLLSP